MIVYDLVCACGCRFEGWFHDRADYERQQEEGLLSCPACGGSEVHKVLSPVAYHGGQGGQGGREAVQAAVAAFGLALKRYVERNFEDVGTRFAETALRIHYGIDEARNIRGVATEAEEKMLRDEGVEFITIPVPKTDDSDLN